jgi:hypothetical protein
MHMHWLTTGLEQHFSRIIYLSLATRRNWSASPRTTSVTKGSGTTCGNSVLRPRERAGSPRTGARVRRATRPPRLASKTRAPPTLATRNMYGLAGDALEMWHSDASAPLNCPRCLNSLKQSSWVKWHQARNYARNSYKNHFVL